MGTPKWEERPTAASWSGWVTLSFIFIRHQEHGGVGRCEAFAPNSGGGLIGRATGGTVRLRFHSAATTTTTWGSTGENQKSSRRRKERKIIDLVRGAERQPERPFSSTASAIPLKTHAICCEKSSTSKKNKGGGIIFRISGLTKQSRGMGLSPMEDIFRGRKCGQKGGM